MVQHLHQNDQSLKVFSHCYCEVTAGICQANSAGTRRSPSYFNDGCRSGSDIDYALSDASVHLSMSGRQTRVSGLPIKGTGRPSSCVRLLYNKMLTTNNQFQRCVLSFLTFEMKQKRKALQPSRRNRNLEDAQVVKL